MTLLRRGVLISAAAVQLLSRSVPVSGRQAPTFSSSTDIVAVDVLVTDGRNPVAGLQAADFEVIDNGVRQQIALVSQGQIPLRVVLAMDVSGSVAGDRLARLRAAAGSAAAALRADDSLAILTFGSRILWRQLSSRDAAAIDPIFQPRADPGDTALIDASYAAMTLGESDGRRGLVVVFSDGVDTSSFLSASSVIDSAKRADAVLFAVSVGGVAQPFLSELTSTTGGRLLQVESDRSLGETLQSIVREFHARYLVTYEPAGVERAGWHRIEVRLKNRRATVSARPGYLAGA